MAIIPSNVIQSLNEYFEETPVDENNEEVEEVEEVVDTEKTPNVEVEEIETEVNPFQKLFDEVVDEEVKDETRGIRETLLPSGEKIQINNITYQRPSFVDDIYNSETQLFNLDNILSEDAREKAEQFNTRIEEEKNLIKESEASFNRLIEVARPNEIITDDQGVEYKYEIKENEEGEGFIEYFVKNKDEEDFVVLDLQSDNAAEVVKKFGHLPKDWEPTYTYDLAPTKTLTRAQQYQALGWEADETINIEDYNRLGGITEPNHAAILKGDAPDLLALDLTSDSDFRAQPGQIRRGIIQASLDNPYAFRYFKENSESKRDVNEFVETYYPDIFLEEERLDDFKGWLNYHGIVDEYTKAVEVSETLGPLGRYSEEEGGIGEAERALLITSVPFIGSEIEKLFPEDSKAAAEFALATYLDTYMMEVNNRDHALRRWENVEKKIEEKGVSPWAKGGGNTVHSYWIESNKDTPRFNYFDPNVSVNYLKDNFPAYWDKIEQNKIYREQQQKNQAKYGSSFLSGLGGTITNFGKAVLNGVEDLQTFILNATNEAVKNIGPEDSATVKGFNSLINNYTGIQADDRFFEGLQSQWGGYSYVEGKEAEYDGTTYIKDERGIIYNTDSKFTVGDENPNYESISETLDKSKKFGKSFSIRGFSEATGTVVGDLMVQVALTRGVGMLTKPAQMALLTRVNGFKNVAQYKFAVDLAKSANKLGLPGGKVPLGMKIPIKKTTVDAMLTQSLWFAQSGYNRTFRSLTQQGIGQEEAQAIAMNVSWKFGIVGALTAPIAPLAKWNNAAVNKMMQNQIFRKFASEYVEKGYTNAFQQLSKRVGNILSKGAIPARTFIYEGSREVVQEVTQQGIEVYGINPLINEELAYRNLDVVPETMTAQEVKNLAMQAFAAGGLGSTVTNTSLYKTSPTTIQSLYWGGQNPDATKKWLDKMVQNNQLTLDDVDLIMQDIRAVNNTMGTLEKWIPADIQLSVARTQNKIDGLKNKKKQMKMEGAVLTVVNSQIDAAQGELDALLQPVVTKLMGELNVGVEAISKELGQDFLELDADGVANKIKEILAENPNANIDEKNSTDYATFITIPELDEEGNIISERYVVLVNKDESLKDNFFTSGQHEGFHGLLASLVLKHKQDLAKWEKGGKKGKAPENVISKLGVALSNELSTNEKIKFNDDEYANRVLQYINDKTLNPETILEELMPLLSEALTRGSIEIDEDSGDKIGNFFRRFLRFFGINAKFKTGADVINLIKDYNKAVEKGKGLSRGLRKIAEGEIEEDLDVDVEEAVEDIQTQRAVTAFEKKIQQADIKASKKLTDLISDFQKGEATFTQLEGQYLKVGKSELKRWVARQPKMTLDFQNPKTITKIEQKLRAQFPSFEKNFDADKSEATTYMGNIAKRVGIEIAKEGARQSQQVSADVLLEKGFSPETTEQKDFDSASRKDTSRKKKYVSSIPAVKKEITENVAKDLVGGVDADGRATGLAKDIIGNIGRNTDPESVAKDIIAGTKDKRVMQIMRELVGRWGSPEYNSFVDNIINQGLIAAIPVATIKRRLGRQSNIDSGLINYKKIGKVDQIKVKDGKKTYSRPDVYSITKLNKEKLKEYYKETEKRQQSLFSMLTEGILAEGLQTLRNDKGFMDRLTTVLDLKKSPLTASEFMDGLEQKLDQRSKEDTSLDQVKAAKKLDKTIMNSLGRAKNIKAVFNILNTNNILESDLTPDKINKIGTQLEEYVTKYGITSNTLQGSKMFNFGKQYKKDENGNKSFVVINNSTGKIQLRKAAVNEKGKQVAPKINLETHNFFPGMFDPSTLTIEDGKIKGVKARGAIFWGDQDPLYKAIEKAAKANNKLNKLPKNRKLSINRTPGVVITKGWINTILRSVDNSGKISRQKIMDNNMDVLENAMLELQLAVQKGMPLEYAALFISQGYQATSGIIKTAAPFRYVYADLKPGQDFREEHNPPASTVGGYLLYAIKQGRVKDIMKGLRDNYYQTQIPLTNDAEINNAGLQSTIPQDTDIFTNSAIRLIDAGQDLNKYINPRTGKSLADDLGLYLEPRNRTADNINEQRNLARQIIMNDLYINEAVKEIKSSKKVNNKSSQQVNNNKTNLFPLIKRNSTTDSSIKAMSDADKTSVLGKKIDKPKKGISVFDFDDTIAYSDSKVIVEMIDGTSKEITPAQFAKTASDLEAEGAIFDFSQFDKVIKGRKGPLADIALKRQGKFGSGDIFILTARPQESAPAIKMFLDGIGLNIPIANITGLADGTPDAKALWVLDKTAQGYNDFYFADDSLANVQAVKNILDQVDVKSKVQQAKASKKINLDKEFNVIIEQQSGKEWFKTYSQARAKVEGRKSNRFEFFIPPSAEDFTGLMYKILPKGEKGNNAMKWIKDNLLDPFNKAEQEIIEAKISVANDFKALRNSIDNIPTNLQDEAGHSNFTWSQALRVYIWNMQGMEIPGLSNRDLKALNKLIESNPNMKVFAEKIAFIQKGRDYPAPKKDWVSGSITSDIINGIQKVYRKKALTEWQENVDIIFSKKNMNKLEAIYGSNYIKSLENILNRMKRGSNRPLSQNAQVDNVMDWLNNSVGTIMFLNSKSALLQLISSINFINWSDNNIFAAATAFANQKNYWKTVMKLLNSDYLVQRRKGLKINVAESEIAEASKQGGMKGVIAYLLNKGFVLTRIADSLAIATGGATFYINRLAKLQTQINPDTGKLYSKAEAEVKAFDDFYQISEESQQSSRTDRISMQQASGLGRLVLNFANTPMQYARLIKKSTKDLMAGRGDWKSNLSKIIYYGAIQNLIFNALQQALFVFMFDEEEEKNRTKADKKYDIGFGMLSSLLRGLGYGGALVDTVISVGREINTQRKKKSPDFEEAVWSVFDFSPAIDSKIRKLRSAANTWKFNKKEIKRRGFNLENPAYLAIGQIISSTLNVPLDRALRMAMSLKQASDRDVELWQRVALVLGYTSWQVGLPYWGTTTTIENEAKEDDKIKNKYKNDARKLRDQGYKRIPMTKGKPPGKLMEDYIEVVRPTGDVEYWIIPKMKIK